MALVTQTRDDKEDRRQKWQRRQKGGLETAEMTEEHIGFYELVYSIENVDQGEFK